MNQGIIYIFSAPSGTGKSSLIQALLKIKPFCNIQVSISHTTRIPRSGEIHGKHYFFIDQNKFKTMINQNEFIEYEKIFGNYYGTSQKIVDKALVNGADIFLDINWKGAQQIRAKIPKTRSIFILPPSKEELNRRIRSRGKDSEEIIIKRMMQAISEIDHYVEYDYLIINDNFNTALKNLKTIILSENLRMYRQKKKYCNLIKKLLMD